jgi:hypothetical protein
MIAATPQDQLWVAEERHKQCTAHLLKKLSSMHLGTAPNIILVGAELEGVDEALQKTYGARPMHATSSEALKLLDVNPIDMVVINLATADSGVTELIEKAGRCQADTVTVGGSDWSENVLQRARPLFALFDTDEHPAITLPTP